MESDAACNDGKCLCDLPDAFIHMLYSRLTKPERKSLRAACRAYRTIANSHTQALRICLGQLPVHKLALLLATFPALQQVITEGDVFLAAEGMTGLLAAANRCRILNFSSCPLTDNAVEALASANINISTLRAKLAGLAYGKSINLMSRLKTLSELHIVDAGKLAAQDLSSLKDLTNLHTLHLDKCALEDGAISELSSISSLRDLSLWGTKSSPPDAITALHALTHLSSLQAGNTHGAPSLTALSSLTTLQHLKYTSATHADDYPSLNAAESQALACLTALTSLDLPRMDINYAKADAVLSHPALLHLTCNELGPRSDADIIRSKLTHITTNSTPYRQDNGSDPALPPSLEHVSLHSACCDGHLVQLQHTPGLTSLTILDLYALWSPERTLRSIMPHLTRLQQLSLAHSTMDDAAFKALASATALTSLCISNFDSITDVAATALISCSHLREVTFVRCHGLSRMAAAMLARMPSVRRVALLRCSGVGREDVSWVAEWAGMVLELVDEQEAGGGGVGRGVADDGEGEGCLVAVVAV
jgi:hypothetical protein